MTDFFQLEAQPSALPDLPRDVVAHLFAFLDKPTSACLGLTCRELYDLHWHYYKSPIPLVSMKKLEDVVAVEAAEVQEVVETQVATETQESEKAQEAPLYELLMGWMGPQYRYCRCIGRFIKKEIYGELSSTAEDDLIQREWDYVLSDGRLPSPFNMGLKWYPLARAYIHKDYENAEDKEEWWRFWSRLRVFFHVSWYDGCVDPILLAPKVEKL